MKRKHNHNHKSNGSTIKLHGYQPGDLIFGVQKDRAPIIQRIRKNRQKDDTYITIDELNKDMEERGKPNEAKINDHNRAFVQAYADAFNSDEYNSLDPQDSFEKENKTRQLCQFSTKYAASQTGTHGANCFSIIFDITSLKDHQSNHDSEYEGYTSAEIRTVARELKINPTATKNFIFLDKRERISHDIAIQRVLKGENVCAKEDSPLEKKSRRSTRHLPITDSKEPKRVYAKAKADADLLAGGEATADAITMASIPTVIAHPALSEATNTTGIKSPVGLFSAPKTPNRDPAENIKKKGRGAENANRRLFS